MAWTLCSKEDVQSLTPITSGELQDIWSEWAEALVKQHLGAYYLGDNTAITNELHDGQNSNILIVRYPPIVSVSALSSNEAAYTPVEYVVYPTRIELRYTTFPEGQQNVSVSYVSGGTVPYTIRLATASVIVAIANYNRRVNSDGSIKWGDLPQGAGQPSAAMSVGLHSYIVDILKLLTRRMKLRMG